MHGSAGLISVLLVGLAWPALANDPEALVKAYVDKVLVNSLDQPDVHEPYFSEIQLLNDFSADFVAAYATALIKVRERGDVSLFEGDPITGDDNRCPIGTSSVADLTRPDTPLMIEARLDNTACNRDGSQPRTGIRLMFFLEKDAAGTGPYRIDDVLRFVDEGKWFSLKAWLERRGRS